MQGYVLSRYLADQPPQTVNADKPEEMIRDGIDISMARPDGELYAVEVDGLRLVLWTQCAESGAIAGIVPAGEVVEVVLSGERWCCVQYGGVQGYCKTELLRVI